MKVDVDEPTLQQIAQITGGEYFRATDNNKLTEIYRQIDKLEKSKIDVKQYSRKNEMYLRFALAGAVFLVLSLFLKVTVFRNIP
jgi:Ca-activated chloride channel family protein